MLVHLFPLGMHDSDNDAASIGMLLDARKDERCVSGVVCGLVVKLHSWICANVNSYPEASKALVSL